jgi:uncharacterized membrane protein YdjX (TVP38/TMEM64 family)
LRRVAPLLALAVAAGLIFATGWHRQLSFETLVRHHMAIEDFVSEQGFAAVAGFIALYIAVVALSIPGAVYLTIASGILFGTLVGALTSVVGATIGATLLFLIAKTACGEHLLRRAGPTAERLAEGFRQDAFCYLLFLRLVPVFPFFLVNLVPAVVGVRLVPFLAATAIGIIPAAFAFAFFGAGLASVVAVQAAAYRACLTAGRAPCAVDFDLNAVLTPQLMLALAALGVLALVPIVVKRMRARRMARSSD